MKNQLIGSFGCSLFNRLSLIFSVVFRLGLKNLWRISVYRIGLAHWVRSQGAPENLKLGNIFSGEGLDDSASGHSYLIHQKLFGWHDVSFSAPPDWHADYVNGLPRAFCGVEWHQALKLLPEGADVKNYWELSRFYWAPELAYKHVSGDRGAMAILDEWISDWLQCNPPYKGINWACGQESAIRVMNVVLSCLILGLEKQNNAALEQFLCIHLYRINRTLRYALSQQNNHGSAEAVALYVGGSLLCSLTNSQFAKKSRDVGRKWLVNRALMLIQDDGTSNQYSSTYHRANLEVFCLAELWRCYVGDISFPAEFYSRVIEGGKWLYDICDSRTGDVPNLGPNDGSHLFTLTRSEYRDFRPTIALVAALFDDSKVDFIDDNYEQRFNHLGVSLNTDKVWVARANHIFGKGGIYKLSKNNSEVFMRYPVFNFRPGHADALHVDLRVGGEFILRDAGTYSYESEEKNLDKVQYHNTVAFDDRDQMPKLGRFLYAKWVACDFHSEISSETSSSSVVASYKDFERCRHIRKLTIFESGLEIEDEISGFKKNAILRWRLKPGEWKINSNGVECPGFRIDVRASVLIRKIALVNGLESLYYGKKTVLPVLEVEVEAPGKLITNVTWA